jgi:hypothetical protein
MYDFLEHPMEAWEFCREWYQPTEEEETSRDYKGRCNKLLARVLSQSEESVKRWGSRFERMPQNHKQTLSYIYSLRKVLEITSAHKDILASVLEQLRKEGRL